MSLRLVLSIATLLALVNPVAAQRIFESPEPPLAEDPNGSRPAAGRDALQLTSNARLIDAAAPLVRATVQAPTMHAAGAPLPVKLLVENTARSPAQNVTVTYALPAGATIANAVPESSVPGGSAWRFDTLAAGARKEISFTVTPAAGATDLDHKVRITCEFEQTAKTHFAKPELKLRKSGPDQALKHDILVFALDVTNAGAAELTDVQLIDALPDGLEHRPDDPTARNQPTASKPASEISADKKTRTFKVGRLPPGQSRRIEYYVLATGAVGPVPHKAQAVAAGGSVTVNAESKVVIAEPKLELTVDTPPRRPANQPARMQIKLTNRSLRALANIVVTDRITGGATADAVSSGGQSFNGLVQWIVPVLAPNETRLLEATIRCPQGGSVAHKVAAVYRGLSQSADAATEFEALAALQWDFRATSFAVELNGEVTYTLTVRNVGSAPATTVRAAIVLPAEMRVVKSSPNAPADGGKVLFDAVTLPPGGRVVFTATAKAIQTIVEGRVVGEVTADVLTAGPVRKQEAITIGRNDAAVPTAPAPPPPRPPQPAPPPRP